MKFMKLIAIIMVVFFVSIIHYNQTVKSEDVYPTKMYVSCKSLDLYRWSKDSTPTMNFVISNHYGNLIGEIIPSTDWIKVSDPVFESNLKEIIVKLDVSNLPPGLYQEKIVIKSNGGDYTLPVRLDLVEKKVIIQLVLDNKFVVVDSKPIELNSAPFIKQGLTYLPLRIICDSFGAKTSFEYVGKERTKVISVLYKDQLIKFFFFENYVEVNGIKRNIDGPICIWSNTAFIPLAVIEDIFHPTIQFNADYRMVTILY